MLYGVAINFLSRFQPLSPSLSYGKTLSFYWQRRRWLACLQTKRECSERPDQLCVCTTSSANYHWRQFSCLRLGRGVRWVVNSRWARDSEHCYSWLANIIHVAVFGFTSEVCNKSRRLSNGHWANVTLYTFLLLALYSALFACFSMISRLNH